MSARMRSRVFDGAVRDRLLATGLRERDVFPHRVLVLPKPGPDGRKLAARMGLRIRAGDHLQLVVHALPDALDGIAPELWFDDEILWHRQHFGLPGQVASVSLFVSGRTIYTAAHQSDVVQRIGRRRALKTRVEKRFNGWDRLLLNAVLAVASERGMDAVCIPTAATAMRHTDGARDVQRELFERVYDRHVRERFDAVPDGSWWRVDLRRNRERFVVAPVTHDVISSSPAVCVCHDIEGGRGHSDVEPDFAELAERTAPRHRHDMLTIERDLGVRATYNVLGTLWREVEADVRSDGHAVAFHSFDHTVDAPRGRAQRLRSRLGLDRAARRRGYRQLAECRSLDGQVRGYRPPQSRLGPATDEDRLAWFNFEWLASSRSAFGFECPQLERGVVKLPIDVDDHPLHLGMAYDSWCDAALARAASDRAGPFVLSLHDCYGDRWLPRYRELLQRLGDLGPLRTLDEVADEVILAAAC